VGATKINLRSTARLDGWLTGRVNSDVEPRPQLTFKSDQSAANADPVFRLTTDPQNDPQKITTVVATVTGVKQAGSFDADLAFESNDFGKLRIVYLPFNVTVDGPDTNKLDLSLVDNQVTTFTLKNDDPVAYPVIWRLNIDGREICGGQLTLPAKGLGLLQCKPSVPFKRVGIGDLFKAESTEGAGRSLLLYPVLPGTSASFDPSSPWKSIPVKASLSWFGPAYQEYLGYSVIFAILTLGGLTSLALSQALPNRLRRLHIKERLSNATDATANLTSNIGSRLQVLLRLERNRLEDLLKSRNTFSPDFADIAKRCNEGATRLESRLKLAQQIDVVLGRLEEKLPLGPPPSQIIAIEELIDDAKVLLSKTEPTDKDLEMAQTSIAEASNKVDIVNQTDDTFGQSLAKRVLEVQTDIKTDFASDPLFQKLDSDLPGPFKAVQRVSNTAAPIPSLKYAELDMAVEKLTLMKEYVMLAQGTQEKEMLERLDKYRPKLLGYLQLQSWPAIRSARLLMRQMKDDVYPSRLREALLAKSATIMMTAMRAYHRAPLEFCVCFTSPVLENSAAREEWTCHWAFGDDLNETGWTVSHYFQLKRDGRLKRLVQQDFNIKATFVDDVGNVLKDPATNEPLTLEKPVTVFPAREQPFFGERARTELLKLMAALSIAVLALMAGAREELMKLDILPGLIAVFTIGFGADTIKNLLTKTETTS
jgi:hypothetical protein